MLVYPCFFTTSLNDHQFMLSSTIIAKPQAQFLLSELQH